MDRAPPPKETPEDPGRRAPTRRAMRPDVPGRYLVHTFGCQMNAHDSDRMEEVLQAHGWTQAETADEVDLIVLNTCSVREKAEQKLRSEVGKLAPLKANHPGLVVAV